MEAEEARGDKQGVADTLGNIGNVYESRGEYAKALSTYERALAAKGALGDKLGGASTRGRVWVAEVAVAGLATAADQGHRVGGVVVHDVCQVHVRASSCVSSHTAIVRSRS